MKDTAHMDKNLTPEAAPPRGTLSAPKLVAVALAAIVLLAALWVKHNIYASEFTPTELSAGERQALEGKLARLEGSAQNDRHAIKIRRRGPASPPLEPEPYSEAGAKREISLTEKELNGLIADEPELARRVAIGLSKDMVSLKLLVPLDQEVPVLGGKTLRLNMGVALSYENNRPVVALKGVSLGGIPLPNAWFGNLKNVNLAQEFGDEGGFWKLFSDGVQDVQVEEGHIRIRLKD